MTKTTTLQHTPGPWFEEDDAYITISSRPTRGTLLATTTGTNRAANARLIAAAPELLGALSDARDILASPPSAYDQRTHDAVLARARAAVEKAEGG